MRFLLLPLLSSAALLAAAPAVLAAPAIIAKAEITATSAGDGLDLSGLTETLENGLPAAMLGGFGSGIAYAGNGELLGLPDRGPNATPFDPKIDDTVSFIPRFHTLSFELKPSAAGAALPFEMSLGVTRTTLLGAKTPLVYGSGEGLDVGPGAPAANKDGTLYFSGRSDNFDPSKSSCNPDNARFDAESIRVSKDGKTVYISDEYGPYLYAFDRETGMRTKAFALPENLCIDKLSPLVKSEIADNTAGRTTNKGMEGLAITPDGKTLVGAMQAALVQDAADKESKKLVRLVSVDIETGTMHEYAYKLTAGSGISDILAINDHQFLVDERDGAGLGDNGSVAKEKKLFVIDLDGAKDITDLGGKEAVKLAVDKTLFLDLVEGLGAIGIAPDKVPSKIEGLAFGPDVTKDGTTLHTLFIANDNDFLPKDAGPNVIYTVGFTDADLPGLGM